MVPWTVGKQNHRLAVRLVFFVVAFVGLPIFFLRYMSIGTFCFLDPFFGIQYIAVGIGNSFGLASTNALACSVRSGKIKLVCYWRHFGFNYSCFDFGRYHCLFFNSRIGNPGDRNPQSSNHRTGKWKRTPGESSSYDSSHSF